MRPIFSIFGSLLLFLVNGPRVDSSTPRESVNGVEGKSLTLSCPVPAGVNIVTWKKTTLLGESVITYGFTAGKARSLSYGEKWPRGQVTVSGSDITITQLNKSRDAGIILCGKTVGLVQGTWKIYDVTVNVPPTILSFTKDGSTVGDGDLILVEYVGTTLSVLVNPETDKPYSVEWRVGNGMLKDSTEVTYTVKAKKDWHGKKLQCVVKNAYGESRKEWMLVIYYGPIIKLSPNQETFIVREHSKLEITASGDARPLVNEIKWAVNRKDIFSNSGLLKFSSITRDKAGNYTVFVGNSVKDVTKDITIIVQYPLAVKVTKVSEGKLSCTNEPSEPSEPTYYSFLHRVEDTEVRTLPVRGSGTSVTVRYNASSYEDNGRYVCTTRNSIGTGTASIKITTNSAPVIVNYPKKSIIGINETKEIVVEFYSARKLVKEEWTQRRGGVDVAPLWNVVGIRRFTPSVGTLRFHGKFVRIPVLKSALEIRNAQQYNSGIYKVVLDNGKSVTVSLNLTVTNQPTTSTKTRNPTCGSGKLGVNRIFIVSTVAAILLIRHY